MEVKEAIEFLERHRCGTEKLLRAVFKIKGKENNFKFPTIDEFINLLQQGEAYRLILKALDKKYGHYLIGVKDNGEVGVGYTIRDLIDISYQKYFPKNKVKDDYTIPE